MYIYIYINTYVSMSFGYCLPTLASVWSPVTLQGPPAHAFVLSDVHTAGVAKLVASRVAARITQESK